VDRNQTVVDAVIPLHQSNGDHQRDTKAPCGYDSSILSFYLNLRVVVNLLALLKMNRCSSSDICLRTSKSQRTEESMNSRHDTNCINKKQKKEN